MNLNVSFALIKESHPCGFCIGSPSRDSPEDAKINRGGGPHPYLILLKRQHYSLFSDKIVGFTCIHSASKLVLLTDLPVNNTCLFAASSKGFFACYLLLWSAVTGSDYKRKSWSVNTVASQLKKDMTQLISHLTILYHLSSPKAKCEILKNSDGALKQMYYSELSEGKKFTCISHQESNGLL